ncbi:MAG: hypothetical protein P8R54_02325 [Myxococcota bacterium]|nr:hypothetical protein [Myxococcota bacterium]
MDPAFAGFREPHAWLIRGLVEYGWPDVTRAGGRVPPGMFGGFDLTRFAGGYGREGFSLCVPAIVEEQWLKEDGVYDFVIKMTRSPSGEMVFAVRCPEANFFEEFVFDRANPLHIAGYIHQSLTTYVPDFVRWRQGGGEVTWAQRAGMPEVQGEPCSSLLSQFINERVNLRRSMDVGPAESWWMDGESEGWAGGAIASVGRAAENERGEDGELQEAARFLAESTVKPPGMALTTMATIGLLNGFLWLGNVALTVSFMATDLLTGDPSRYVFSMMISSVIGFSLISGGALAMAGARKYRKLENGPLMWFSIAYAAASPACCLLGAPFAAWAIYSWLRPEVKDFRSTPLLR